MLNDFRNNTNLFEGLGYSHLTLSYLVRKQFSNNNKSVLSENSLLSRGPGLQWSILKLIVWISVLDGV